jgi:hypothetical protein
MLKYKKKLWCEEQGIEEGLSHLHRTISVLISFSVTSYFQLKKKMIFNLITERLN